MVKKGNISTKYLFASILMLIFVLNDLMFDFLFNFTASNYLSFGFTLLASLLTFAGNYGVVKFEITHKTDKISLFVRSNFNLPQTVFSVLDIFCGLISLFSGILFLGGIFKVIKIIYIPIRFITIANKGKSIYKAITRFSLIWVTGRLLTNKYKGVNKMRLSTWIKNNKLTLTYCVILPPISGFTSFKLLPTFFALPLWLNILLAVFVGLAIIGLTILLGGDKLRPAIFRQFAKTLSDDNYHSVVEFTNKLLAEQYIHEEAIKELKKREEEQKEAQINEKFQMSENERKAKIEAEIEKLKRLED